MSSIDMSACHEEVARKGILQPCDKVAVALARDPMNGDSYPVCAYHARGDLVPLVDVLAECRAETLDEQPHLRVVSIPAPMCPECACGKHVNCTGWALTATDSVVDCGCDHA